MGRYGMSQLCFFSPHPQGPISIRAHGMEKVYMKADSDMPRYYHGTGTSTPKSPAKH